MRTHRGGLALQRGGLWITQKPFKYFMQRRATLAQIRGAMQRVKRFQPQDMAGINRIGIADQFTDLRYKKFARAGRDRGARCRARGGRYRRIGGIQRLGPSQIFCGPRTHLRQGPITTLRRQALQQICQSVQPARGNRLGLGAAQRTAQHNTARGNRLLEIMGRQPNLTFRQQQPGCMAQTAIQPRVG